MWSSSCNDGPDAKLMEQQQCQINSEGLKPGRALSVTTQTDAILLDSEHIRIWVTLTLVYLLLRFQVKNHSTWFSRWTKEEIQWLLNVWNSSWLDHCPPASLRVKFDTAIILKHSHLMMSTLTTSQCLPLPFPFNCYLYHVPFIPPFNQLHSVTQTFTSQQKTFTLNKPSSGRPSFSPTIHLSLAEMSHQGVQVSPVRRSIQGTLPHHAESHAQGGPDIVGHHSGCSSSRPSWGSCSILGSLALER